VSASRVSRRASPSAPFRIERASGLALAITGGDRAVDRLVVGHAGPGVRDHRGLVAVRGGLLGRLAACLRGDAPDVRRRRRRLAADVRRAGGILRVQGGARRQLDENYGLNAQPNGSSVPLNLAAPAAVKYYYDTRRTGSPTTATPSSRWRRAATSRAGVPRRLAAGLPAVVARGPRRRRDLHVLDIAAAGG